MGCEETSTMLQIVRFRNETATFCVHNVENILQCLEAVCKIFKIDVPHSK